MADNSASSNTTIHVQDLLDNYRQHFSQVKDAVNNAISGTYGLEIKENMSETLEDLDAKLNNEALSSKMFLSSFGWQASNMKSFSGLYAYWKGPTGKDYSGNGLLVTKPWHKNAYHFIPNNQEHPYGLDLINVGSFHDTHIDSSQNVVCDRYILIDTEAQKVYPVRTMHNNPLSGKFPFDNPVIGIDSNIDVEKFNTVFGNNLLHI